MGWWNRIHRSSKTAVITTMLHIRRTTILTNCRSDTDRSRRSCYRRRGGSRWTSNILRRHR
ncbi:unnamed protein product [Nippostrongylus brasiliensis]|uniref:Secreted protein n=1 Tax=Nippostrongylus brasiliensis TaxID=27835 RepID=A0A0N4XT08_NIPBR|nr:unnamed protein product [Nippostrongylus brasiliensis]